MPRRPERLVLVAGTGTEVGKTWAACRLARLLREREVAVAARKPAQSFDPGDEPGATDAALLAAATGASPQEVCPPHRWYPVPMAPPMAAETLGRPAFTIADLVEETSWPSAAVVGLVEGAGGVRSPLAADGDLVDLAARLDPDLVVLVADATLGTIHAVRSSAAPLEPWPLVVLLNRWDSDDDLHRRNRRWLAERDRLTVVADVAELVPHVVGRAV